MEGVEAEDKSCTERHKSNSISSALFIWIRSRFLSLNISSLCSDFPPTSQRRNSGALWVWLSVTSFLAEAQLPPCPLLRLSVPFPHRSLASTSPSGPNLDGDNCRFHLHHLSSQSLLSLIVDLSSPVAVVPWFVTMFNLRFSSLWWCDSHMYSEEIVVWILNFDLFLAQQRQLDRYSCDAEQWQQVTALRWSRDYPRDQLMLPRVLCCLCFGILCFVGLHLIMFAKCPCVCTHRHFIILSTLL